MCKIIFKTRAQNYSPSKKGDLRSPFSKVDFWPKLETQTIDRGDSNESHLLAEVTLSRLAAVIDESKLLISAKKKKS